jgi:hypothetical protein
VFVIVVARLLSGSLNSTYSSEAASEAQKQENRRRKERMAPDPLMALFVAAVFSVLFYRSDQEI